MKTRWRAAVCGSSTCCAPDLLKTHIEAACKEKNAIAHALFGTGTALDPAKMYDEYAAAAEQIAAFCGGHGADAERILRDGGSVMFEGAQGTMLDIDHGTYPFVTSSSATAGGAATGTGRGPDGDRHGDRSDQGVCDAGGRRAVPDRDSRCGRAIICARAGNEYGAVTGRPRRCGWLDIPLLRYSNQVNGAEWLVVTKMDVLDELEEIPSA